MSKFTDKFTDDQANAERLKLNTQIHENQWPHVMIMVDEVFSVKGSGIYFLGKLGGSTAVTKMMIGLLNALISQNPPKKEVIVALWHSIPELMDEGSINNLKI